MEADVRWCPQCEGRGEEKRLRLLQINDSSAALLCENDKCVHLGEVSSVSSLILRRKSSEIPNAKKKKCRSVPVVGSSTKMDINISPNFPKCNGPSHSTPDNAVRLPDGLACSSFSESPQILSSETASLLASAVSLKATPQVALWRNKSALCWLDACMCLLVSCRSLRSCLAKLPAKSPIKTLCVEFVAAQGLPTPDNARTVKVSKTSASHRQSTPRQELNEPHPTVLPTLRPTEGTNARSVGNLTDLSHNQAETANNASQNQKVDLVGLKLGANARPGETVSEPLDGVRDELFQKLQPKLKCDIGQDNSPVFALPSLLRLDGSVEEHFMCRYRWEFYCSACGHAEVNMSKNTLPTFTSVPADFTMVDPVMLHSCHRCGSPKQRSHLVFHSSPACLMMHFQEGLPDGDLTRHRAFTLGRDTYTLSAVVRYRRHPDHFVTMIRDQETNHWLEYDDLLPSPFTWQSHPPSIPADEIHIVAWERAETPCRACVQMHNDVVVIRDTPVRTAASSIPAEKTDPAPPQTRLPHCNGNGMWRKSKFAPLSVFRREAEQEWHAASGSNAAGRSQGTKVSDETAIAAEAVDKVIDLTTETVCDFREDPVTEGDKESRAESRLDPSDLDKDGARGTPKLFQSGLVGCSRRSGFKQTESAGKPHRSEQDRGVAVESKEPEQLRKDLKTKRNATAKPEPKPQITELTFLGKLKSRRKSRIDRETDAAKSAVSAILRTIPEQLLQSPRNATAASRPKTERGSLNKRVTSTNSSVLSSIPKQLLSGAVNPQTGLPQSQVVQSRTVARPILVGSSCRVPSKQVKFQPYGQQTTQQGPKDRLPLTQGVRSNVSTLGSWQKRVGMYSSSATLPRKRMRRDSAEDSSSVYPDLPKQAGPPCSSVSSPSACSDISSISDNHSFTSNKGDLINTVDELCKILEIGSEYTPSVSSRFSSPSQDMFFSELLSDDTVWAEPKDKDNDHPSEKSSRLQTSGTPHGNHALVTMTTASSQERLVTSPSLHTQTDCPNDVVAPSVETVNPAVTALEGTLPSVGELSPAVVPVGSTVPSAQPARLHSTMLPSCVTLQPIPVAMQQLNSIKPVQNAEGARTHVTLPNDHMFGACSFPSLTSPTTGENTTASICRPSSNEVVNCETATDLDDITDPELFGDIQDSLAAMETEDWSDHFMELLAQ